jgi:hypothetical protein
MTLITIVALVVAIVGVGISWRFARWYMGDERSSPFFDPKVLDQIRRDDKLRNYVDRAEWEKIRTRLTGVSVEQVANATGVRNNKSLVASWLRPPSARWRGSSVPHREWWPALEALAKPGPFEKDYWTVG